MTIFLLCAQLYIKQKLAKKTSSFVEPNGLEKFIKLLYTKRDCCNNTTGKLSLSRTIVGE